MGTIPNLGFIFESSEVSQSKVVYPGLLKLICELGFVEHRISE